MVKIVFEANNLADEINIEWQEFWSSPSLNFKIPSPTEKFMNIYSKHIKDGLHTVLIEYYSIDVHTRDTNAPSKHYLYSTFDIERDSTHPADYLRNIKNKFDKSKFSQHSLTTIKDSQNYNERTPVGLKQQEKGHQGEDKNLNRPYWLTDEILKQKRGRFRIKFQKPYLYLSTDQWSHVDQPNVTPSNNAKPVLYALYKIYHRDFIRGHFTLESNPIHATLTYIFNTLKRLQTPQLSSEEDSLFNQYVHVDLSPTNVPIAHLEINYELLKPTQKAFYSETKQNCSYIIKKETLYYQNQTLFEYNIWSNGFYELSEDQWLDLPLVRLDDIISYSKPKSFSAPPLKVNSPISAASVGSDTFKIVRLSCFNTSKETAKIYDVINKATILQQIMDSQVQISHQNLKLNTPTTGIQHVSLPIPLPYDSGLKIWKLYKSNYLQKLIPDPKLIPQSYHLAYEQLGISPIETVAPQSKSAAIVDEFLHILYARSYFKLKFPPPQYGEFFVRFLVDFPFALPIIALSNKPQLQDVPPDNLYSRDPSKLIQTLASRHISDSDDQDSSYNSKSSETYINKFENANKFSSANNIETLRNLIMVKKKTVPVFLATINIFELGSCSNSYISKESTMTLANHYMKTQLYEEINAERISENEKVKLKLFESINLPESIQHEYLNGYIDIPIEWEKYWSCKYNFDTIGQPTEKQTNKIKPCFLRAMSEALYSQFSSSLFFFGLKRNLLELSKLIYKSSKHYNILRRKGFYYKTLKKLNTKLTILDIQENPNMKNQNLYWNKNVYLPNIYLNYKEYQPYWMSSQPHIIQIFRLSLKEQVIDDFLLSNYGLLIIKMKKLIENEFFIFSKNQLIYPLLIYRPTLKHEHIDHYDYFEKFILHAERKNKETKWTNDDEKNLKGIISENLKFYPSSYQLLPSSTQDYYRILYNVALVELRKDYKNLASTYRRIRIVVSFLNNLSHTSICHTQGWCIKIQNLNYWRYILSGHGNISKKELNIFSPKIEKICNKLHMYKARFLNCDKESSKGYEEIEKRDNIPDDEFIVYNIPYSFDMDYIEYEHRYSMCKSYIYANLGILKRRDKNYRVCAIVTYLASIAHELNKIRIPNMEEIKILNLEAQLMNYFVMNQQVNPFTSSNTYKLWTSFNWEIDTHKYIEPSDRSVCSSPFFLSKPDYHSYVSCDSKVHEYYIISTDGLRTSKNDNIFPKKLTKLESLT